jgi:hypothetical protein
MSTFDLSAAETRLVREALVAVAEMFLGRAKRQVQELDEMVCAPAGGVDRHTDDLRATEARDRAKAALLTRIAARLELGGNPSDEPAYYLLMDLETFADVSRRAQDRLGGPGTWAAIALLTAVIEAELISDEAGDSWRVPCNQEALAFIREFAPDIARRWPAVVGGEDEAATLRSEALAAIGVQAAGKEIAGLEVDREGVARLVLEGGVAIVLAPDGMIDYDEGHLHGTPQESGS